LRILCDARPVPRYEAHVIAREQQHPNNTYLILRPNLRQYFTMTRKKDNMENVRKRIGYNSTMQLRTTTTTRMQYYYKL
jgi:hypothetical protein